MEYIDIVDEQGNPTGEKVERSIAHSQGIRHRTAHIWIVRKVNGRYQRILQLRLLKKFQNLLNRILILWMRQDI